MAKSLKLGICYLITELLADALIVLRLFKTAGAVAASLLESLLYGCDYFFIFVECDLRLHFSKLLSFLRFYYNTLFTVCM